MFRIESNNYLSPYNPMAIYMETEKCEYPSVMAYVYHHLLGNDRKNLEKFFKFYRKKQNFSELQSVYEELYEKHRENFFKNRLEEAYKKVILTNFNNLDKQEWPTVYTTQFNNNVINEILKKLHTNYVKKLTRVEKNEQVKYIKIQDSLKFLLSQGYDIQCFLDKTPDEILESLKQENEDDPLWKKKKCEFLKFYNNLNSSKPSPSFVLSPNMVQDIRQQYLSKSPLGMPEKKTLNDYINSRIKREKIKEMIRIFINEKYAETRSKNTKLIDDDWEEEFNSYSDNMMKSMTLEKKKQFLDFYEKIQQHSNHHLKFIEKLHEQLSSYPFEESPPQDSIRKSIPTQEQLLSTFAQPSSPQTEYETNTQKKLLEQLAENSGAENSGAENSGDENSGDENSRDIHLLDPEYKQLITIDNKQYGSIGCYVHAKFLEWISPNSYMEIFYNPHSKNLDNFKNLKELKELQQHKLNEKKVFLAKKALFTLFFNSDKWHMRNELLKTKSDKIYVYINDPILGVNVEAIGENKIGRTLENIRTLLTKSKPKNEMLDHIYKCSSSPIIKSLVEGKI